MEEFFEFAARGAKSHYRRKPLIDGSYYHVFKRREDGAVVFRDDQDRATYISIIKRLLAPEVFRDERGRPLAPLPCRVDLIAFCVLDNHYHMILWVERAEGMTNFMHRLQTAYGQRFNNRHSRRGSVFDERYDAELIKDEHHLKTLVAYVHANPGKWATTYEWSGHQYFVDRGQSRLAESWFSASHGLKVFGNDSNYLAWFMRAVKARSRKLK